MHASRRILAVSLVVLMALATFAVAASPRATPATRAAIGAKDAAGLPSAPALPFSPTSRYFDPALRDATGRVDVMVAMQASVPTAAVATLIQGARAIPLIGDVRLVRGLVDASKIAELQSSPYVLAILKDRPLPFESSKKMVVPAALAAKLGGLHLPVPTAVERDSLRGGAEISMRDVVNFTGARRAWTQLGVDGTGVTVAVVDTGVDFGAFNLGESAVARDGNGVPMSFDPDGSTLALTLIPATPYPSGGRTLVRTIGTDPLIYIFDLFTAFPGGYGPKAFPWSYFFGGPFPTDMDITGLPASRSGSYRFGVLFEWNFAVDLFPVLLIDAATAGVYDTAVLDLSFDWFLQGFVPTPDFSFADEKVLSTTPAGNVVAARDMNLDGYPDISAGSLAWGLDIWGLDPTPGPGGRRYLAPIDSSGEYATFLYDWESHGTFVSSSAAGRESNHPRAGPGTGPGAHIMGVPIFAWGDVIEGWLYAAGFDLNGTTTLRSVPNYGTVYGTWQYTGNHKANIISNSWGTSDWVTMQQANGWPWYDVLTVIEDALMMPGYSDPAYPGTVMVHAGGNGASGYGTVTEPGFNSLAITVGASTNLNHTGLPYNGTHYDVISWSARGPNFYGVPKPDLLQVGAFAWAAGPIWAGGGSGANAVTAFGGTSQATPVTSGSAAVAIQAWRQGHGGHDPTPAEVKAVLKSSARDLGYDAFVQGAGHIDVYNAAAYAIGRAGILTTTPATWDNLRPWVSAPWSSASVFYGAQVGTNPPVGPINDTSWFAGAVPAGSATSASFTITSTGNASGTIAPVFHSKMVSGFTFTGTTGPLPGPPGSWLEGYGAFQLLLPSLIPSAADLMLIRGSMPYTFLDTDGNYVWDNRSRIIVADWVDDGDTIIEPGEIRVFNYGYDAGTTSEARVGFPVGRFAGIPLFWFSHVPAAGRTFRPMPYRIEVEFYDRLPWSWVTAPATFTVTAGAPARWTATLSVPAGTTPGVYEGQILVTPTGGNATAVPVSVVVPAVIDAATLSVPMTASGSAQIYDPSTVLGYFDWRWRYEAGDWKLWFVDVKDPTTLGLYSEVSWTGANTDVDLISIRPDGIPSDSSFSPYRGSGVFQWSTRSGTTMDYVSVPTSPSFFGGPVPGMYTFALHNVLLGNGGAAATPERLTGSVAAAKLNPRGPVTVITQPGTVVSIPFTLTTGYDIAFVFNFAFPPPTSAFPATVFPSIIAGIAAGESRTFRLNITVPSGTSDGNYLNLLNVGGLPLPSTFVPVNVVVDSTSPVVSLIAPGAGSYVAGTRTISAAASDSNNIASMSFTAGTASGPMTRNPQTGLWTASWNTVTTADGATTVRATSVDAAGNSATDSVAVTVDNTAPTVSFTLPAVNAWVRGTVTVAFSAIDTNLASAVLSFGGQSLVVTGASSAAVNTLLLPDGSQALTLTAEDRAGNVATASLPIRVDNTVPTAVLVSPAAASFLRGTVPFSFVATDANVATAQLTIGTTTLDVAGMTTRSVDTTSLAYGTYTATLTVVDLAGNQASDSKPVTVDNTAPSVTFTSPSGNANLRAGATIAWTITEPNVAQAWLLIDGTQRDVTGSTSYAWDTTRAGDGSHNVTVRVVDKAGNVGSASITVNTDNVAQAVSSGFTNGLLIGLVAAAVVGFFVGWFLGRRRKERPEADMGPPPPTSETPMEEEEL